MSETPLPNKELDVRLEKEFNDALNHIAYVRNILQKLKQEAVAVLK